MNFDFLLQLEKHGWSSGTFFLKEKVYEFTISHVFGDPYADFINALKKLMEGQNETVFYWYGEPGGVKILIKIIPDQKHMISVEIYDFPESFDENIKNFKKVAEFEAQLQSFLIISYLQLKKIFLLLKDKEYSQDRAKYFPFKEFLELESSFPL